MCIRVSRKRAGYTGNRQPLIIPPATIPERNASIARRFSKPIAG
jgi:hypothetical protein